MILATAVILAAISRSPSPAPRVRISPPVSRPVPRPTPRPATRPTASKPATRAYSSRTTYGTAKGRPAGKAPLKSNTPKPEPHTYAGRTYNSSDAIYTNRTGMWVFFWLWVAGTQNNKKEVQCFDKGHKQIDCARDDKSYQKDW